MLNTPALKAIATAVPVSISGMTRTRVAEESAYQLPTDPRQSASSACVTTEPLAASAMALVTVRAKARVRRPAGARALGY